MGEKSSLLDLIFDPFVFLRLKVLAVSVCVSLTFDRVSGSTSHMPLEAICADVMTDPSIKSLS